MVSKEGLEIYYWKKEKRIEVKNFFNFIVNGPARTWRKMMCVGGGFEGIIIIISKRKFSDVWKLCRKLTRAVCSENSIKHNVYN